MPEAVVHDLEVVDVEEHDRDPVLAVALGEHAAQPVDEQQAVRQAGERVVDRLVREELAARALLGHVLDLADEVERAPVSTSRTSETDRFTDTERPLACT